MTIQKSQIIIIGAGAAGLMCAIEAAKRGRKVILLDHANKAGKKILMSGGGRCNFTNLHIDPDKHYISHNKHFCKSALSRYTPQDFINLVNKYQIAFHEKTLGQLFCDHKSQDILNMLLSECEKLNIQLYLNTKINHVNLINTENSPHRFEIKTSPDLFQAESLVIATGGLSIPTMGASAFGYKIAEQFGIKVWPVRAGLVPLTLQPEDKEKFSALSGIAVDSLVSTAGKKFRGNILLTHRGLSGPAILQLSSYWKAGEKIEINFLPEINMAGHLKSLQKQQPKKILKTLLSELLPKKLVEVLLGLVNTTDKSITEEKLQVISDQEFKAIGHIINNYTIIPNGTEGYRTAEVTLGGVDCDAISSKTMESHRVKNLYFIGEVLDVSGWLGGYNFQWAWASGFACGQVV